MAKSTNFTYEQRLVEKLSDQGWLANPAGIEGYVVFVLENKGKAGTQLYCTLKPGETLRFNERLFGRFEAHAVDMRQGRKFVVSGEFAIGEPNRAISLAGNVRYRVVDAQKVALNTVDPLGALRDRVLAVLATQLPRYTMSQITHDVCAKIIASVSYQEDLGLAVESADILSLASDRKALGRLAEREDVQHKIGIDEIKQQATLQAQLIQEQAKLQIQQMWQKGVDLRDPNAVMREHPELIGDIIDRLDQRDRLVLNGSIAFEADRRSVIKTVLEAHIKQELEEGGDIDVNALTDLIDKKLAAPSVDQQRITFGQPQSSTALPGPAPKENVIEFDEGKTETSDSGKHIEFG